MGLPSRRSAICWNAQACLSSIAHSTSFSASLLTFLRFSLSFGSTRFSSRRSASVNIFSPDLPPGLPEMPFVRLQMLWDKLRCLGMEALARLGLSLGGFQLMLQSSLFDGVAFDPFSFQEDGLASAEVDVGWRQVL